MRYKKERKIISMLHLIHTITHTHTHKGKTQQQMNKKQQQGEEHSQGTSIFL